MPPTGYKGGKKCQYCCPNDFRRQKNYLQQLQRCKIQYKIVTAKHAICRQCYMQHVTMKCHTSCKNEMACSMWYWGAILEKICWYALSENEVVCGIQKCLAMLHGKMWYNACHETSKVTKGLSALFGWCLPKFEHLFENFGRTVPARTTDFVPNLAWL